MRKGIILAGGNGKRLQPLTHVVCKQLLPVYDKPMIYYPLSVLMLLGIKDILIISTPHDLPIIQHCLGDGKALGITLSYKVQPKARGIAEVFIIGEEFIAGKPVCLVLGDNIIYSNNLRGTLAECLRVKKGAYIVGLHSTEPERFGVVELGKKGKVLSLEEKPKKPKSDYIAIGLYFYDNKVSTYAKSLVPSVRGELEITDLNKIYLEKKKLKAKMLTRGSVWIDTGTFESLIRATNFIHIIEQQQGLKIACLEEVAFNMGYIDVNQLRKLIKKYDSPYGEYLAKVARKGVQVFRS